MNQRISKSIKLGQQVVQKSAIHSSSVKKNLVHDEENKSFVLHIGKNDYAFIEYERDDQGTFDLVHTEVPDQYRGQGYGKVIAKSVFEYLQQNNFKMKLSCDFLKHFYEQNVNEYSNLIK